MAEQQLNRTWDGLHIAPDQPTGATVVVRRQRADAQHEYLLLHRNAKGADFEGDWAWTSPAGCRQPGESVYPAALRELAEEAGLTGFKPWAVDLSWRKPGGYSWVMFAVDVPSDTQIELVDPEHDRYEWVSAAEARRRLRPGFVLEAQVDRLVRIPTAEVSFRRMTYDDLSNLVRWQAAPNANEWFHGTTLTPAAAIERYGPRIEGEVATRMWVVQIDGRDVGYLQDYRVRDHDEYAVKTGQREAVAFDYLIGEPDLVGQGLGTRMIWEFLRDVLVADYPDAPTFLASPSHRNAVSLRALAKCGFTQGTWIDVPSGPAGESVTEIVCTLDCRHWFG